MPKSMNATGKRSRKYFKTKGAAMRHAAASRTAYHEGIRGAMIPATLAMMAAEAERILEGSGLSVVEAARIAVKSLGNEKDKETFSERYNRAVLSGEAHWSGRYQDDMGRLPRWLPKSFFDLPCGRIDRETMVNALTESGPKSLSTLDMRCRMISAVLGFREKHRKDSTIAILSSDQRKALFEACEDDQERMAVSLLLYAGIRPDAESGEISRLDWEDVGEEEIFISQDVSKVGERIVPMTPALCEIIKDRPKSGTVIPSNWKRKWTRLRKAAGIEATDVTRHTFCSHALAAFGMEKTQRAMGHVPMSQTTRRHYARAVSEADGKAYFGVE